MQRKNPGSAQQGWYAGNGAENTKENPGSAQQGWQAGKGVENTKEKSRQCFSFRVRAKDLEWELFWE